MQKPLYSTKCAAWVAIYKNRTVGPYWFEDKNERAQTVFTERNVEVFTNVFGITGTIRRDKS